jgi:hypothetical protein
MVVARDGVEPPTLVDTICVDQHYWISVNRNWLSLRNGDVLTHARTSEKTRDELGQLSPIPFSTTLLQKKSSNLRAFSLIVVDVVGREQHK